MTTIIKTMSDCGAVSLESIVDGDGKLLGDPILVLNGPPRKKPVVWDNYNHVKLLRTHLRSHLDPKVYNSPICNLQEDCNKLKINFEAISNLFLTIFVEHKKYRKLWKKMKN